jgi:hypothetical protein
MKKLIILGLLLIGLVSLFAVESEPSEVVGFVKIEVQANSWKAISVPFYNEDSSIGNVIVGNFGFEDQIINARTGISADFFDPWDGTLTDLEPGEFYWYHNVDPTNNLNIYCVGKVDPQAVTYTVNNGWNPFSVNNPTVYPIASETFNGVSFEDQIINVNSGLSTDYFDPWDGSLVNFEPGETYWFYHTGDSFTWTNTVGTTRTFIGNIDSSKKMHKSSNKK